MKVTFSEKSEIAPNIFTFTFKPEKQPAYIAGQFIEMYLPHPNKDNRGDKRWFTLSSSPTEANVAITTRFAGQSGSSFKKALFAISPGAEISISSPMGDFVLPKDKSIPIIFVAAGIGCTPFRSITKYLIDSNEPRDISMLYLAKNHTDVAFRDEFSTLQKFQELSGAKLSAEHILDFAGPAETTRYFYLSGPEPLVEKLTKELRRFGISKRHIFTDYFPGYHEL